MIQRLAYLVLIFTASLGYALGSDCNAEQLRNTAAMQAVIVSQYTKTPTLPPTPTALPTNTPNAAWTKTATDTPTRTPTATPTRTP